MVGWETFFPNLSLISFLSQRRSCVGSQPVSGSPKTRESGLRWFSGVPLLLFCLEFPGGASGGVWFLLVPRWRCKCPPGVSRFRTRRKEGKEGRKEAPPTQLHIKGSFEVLERFHWRGCDRAGAFFNEGIFAPRRRSRRVRGG